MSLESMYKDLYLEACSKLYGRAYQIGAISGILSALEGIELPPPVSAKLAELRRVVSDEGLAEAISKASKDLAEIHERGRS